MCIYEINNVLKKNKMNKILIRIFSLYIIILITIMNIKKSFNHIDVLWAFYTLVLLNTLSSIKKEKRVPFIIALLAYKKTRIMIVSTLFLPLIATGGYTYLKMSSFNIYNNCIPTKFLGYPNPRNPTIYIANYPTNLIEYKLFPILADKICLCLNAGRVSTDFLCDIIGSERIIFVKGGGGSFDETQDLIKNKIDNGYSVFAYGEKKYYERKNFYSTSKIASGMFHIAKNINCTVTPIVIDHIHHEFGIIQNSDFKIYIDKTEKVENPSEKVEQVYNLYKRKLSHFSIK